MSEQFKLLLNKSQKIIFPLTQLHGIYFAYKIWVIPKSGKNKRNYFDATINYLLLQPERYLIEKDEQAVIYVRISGSVFTYHPV